MSALLPVLLFAAVAAAPCVRPRPRRGDLWTTPWSSCSMSAPLPVVLVVAAASVT